MPILQEINFVNDYTDCAELLKQAQETSGDDYFHLLQLYAETYHRLRVDLGRILPSTEREAIELQILADVGITPITFLKSLYVYTQYELGLVHAALSDLAMQ